MARQKLEKLKKLLSDIVSKADGKVNYTHDPADIDNHSNVASTP